jgi:hypothetical protein
MRRIIVVLVLVAAAAAGYQYYRTSYGPERHYKAFAEEILRRNYDAATAMADGLTADQLAQQGSQERIGAGPPMFQAVYPSRFTIDSNTKDADGVVTIAATQTVLFTPPGVESARPAMFAVLKQVARLRNGSDGWKVVSFENNFERMDSLGRR